jgi:hypothetical protein
VSRLRALIPDTVTIGISGDASAAVGLLAGCDAWYSVLASSLSGRCSRDTKVCGVLPRSPRSSASWEAGDYLSQATPS